MQTKQVCTFRCSDAMVRFLQHTVEERHIDRTSVLKMAVYLLAVYMQRGDVRKQNLFELIAGMEALAPNGFGNFASFSDM